MSREYTRAASDADAPPVLILAIDTSTRLCSAALGNGGAAWSEVAAGDRRQGEEILPMVQRLLARAGARRSDIDLIAFGRGPGAFTGVRIAVAVVQGLALGLDRPVLPVSTLAALASQAQRRFSARRVLAAMDARMQQIYLGAFHCEAELLAVGAERVGAAALLPLPGEGEWQGIGTGFAAAGDTLRERLGRRLAVLDAEAEPLAEDVLWLARQACASAWLPAEAALPVYLRDEVADPSARQPAEAPAPAPG